MTQPFFCTLFDSGYLARGLVMLRSLKAAAPLARAFVFAFDDRCFRVLTALALPDVTVIPLDALEDDRLLAVKPTRSRAEYCWTCTPAVMLHAIEKYRLPVCTYVDADLRFYQTPEPLLDELGEGSVLITEHRYTPRYDESRKSGKYCVQFVSCRNDERGMRVLRWWRDACLDWCFARAEHGRFGDQKYLDDWPVRFPGVRELAHLGGGVAPWNVQQYDVFVRERRPHLTEKRSGSTFPLVFYHFHALQFYDNGTFDLGYYQVGEPAFRLIYLPYIGDLLRAQTALSAVEPHDYLATRRSPPWPIRALKALKRRLNGTYSIHRLSGIAGEPAAGARGRAHRL